MKNYLLEKKTEEILVFRNVGEFNGKRNNDR